MNQFSLIIISGLVLNRAHENECTFISISRHISMPTCWSSTHKLANLLIVDYASAKQHIDNSVSCKAGMSDVISIRIALRCNILSCARSAQNENWLFGESNNSCVDIFAEIFRAELHACKNSYLIYTSRDKYIHMYMHVDVHFSC